MKNKNINFDDQRTSSEWADLIDEAKNREAINDLSVIAYRILNVVLNLQLKVNKDA